MNFYDDINIYGSSPAIINENSETVSYNSLLSDADKLAKQINKRCLVFSICENCLESVVGYIGFLRMKIVPALISNSINKELLKNLLIKYKPEYIWLPEEKDINIKECSKVYTYKKYCLLKTNFNINYVLNDDLALLLTTSGSTGSPKFVRQSYKNITSNANSIAQYLNIQSSDRPITTLPMYYTYGLSIINSHLLKGASIIITKKTLMNKEFWKLLKDNNATTFGGVPYTYEMLKKLRFSRMQLPNLKILTQAGGKLNLDLSLEFAHICREKNIKFYVMYGQTEATARMSYLPSEYAELKIGSIGIAIPGGKFELIDDEENIVNRSETVGELVYQGDNVTMGYAESCKDLSKGYENSNILKTGDMAKKDKDGFYYIIGRKKRFLKIFGSRVNLDEMEQLIKSAGYDCACNGKDDNLKIFITDKNNVDNVKNFIIKYTNINQAGFKVYYIETIPRNESGKTLYCNLK